MTRLLPLLLVACSQPFEAAPQTPSTLDHPVGEVDFAPAAFARLTSSQYRNLLEDLTGRERPVALQPDTNPYLFASIGASSEPLSEQGVQLLEEAASTVSAEIFADPAARLDLVGCAPESPRDACAEAFIERFGRQAYRRPLTTTEAARWLAVSNTLGDGDPWTGLQTAVAGMLQSPYVVYRVELGVPHPEDPDLRVLTDWEVAARMSLLLWNRPPDAALLDAVARGELSTPEGLAAQADRLLADPRSDEAIEAFFEQYLDLGRLDNASPDPATYPRYTDTLRAAMRSEVLLLVDDLVNRRDADVRKLFSARRAYVNRELATHYGLLVEGATALTYVPVELPEDGERAGILGLGAFLTMNAHAVHTSPTLRGKYILERVLCSMVPPPPDSVDLDLSDEETEGGATLRDTLEAHRDDPECSSCHAIMDPPGFLFEHFDATGAWRETDGGHSIDSSGDLFGVPLAGAGDLGDVLANHERVGPCMVQQLYRHAHGRLDGDADEVTLAQLNAGFAAGGHRFRALLRDVVSHESFRVVRALEASP